MIRPALVIVASYLLGVAALTWWWAPEPPRPIGPWMAGRELVLHHQLQSTDLTGPAERHRQAQMARQSALVGRHLARPRRRGEPITEADTVLAPIYEPGEADSRVAIYRLKGEEYLAGAIVRGQWVVPCFVRMATPRAETRCARSPVLVEAIHRAVTSDDEPWVALRIAKCQAGEIGEYLAREHRFLMVAPRPVGS